MEKGSKWRPLGFNLVLVLRTRPEAATPGNQLSAGTSGAVRLMSQHGSGNWGRAPHFLN